MLKKINICFGFDIRFLLVFIAVYLISCLPVSTSDIDTLDNLSQKDGNFVVNSCGPSSGYGVFNQYASRIKFDGVVDEAFKMAIGQALTAVPVNLRNFMFNTDLTINIKDKAEIDNICNVMYTTERSLLQERYQKGNGFSVCWIKPQNSFTPQIYIEKSIPAIKHSMIRLFSYLYTQLVIPTLLSKHNTLAYSESINIDRLANAFILDLNSSNRFKAFSYIKTIPFEALKNFIFADAMDSFYCNSSSLLSFQSNFIKTYRVFIGSDSNQVSQSSFAYKFGKPWFVH